AGGDGPQHRARGGRGLAAQRRAAGHLGAAAGVIVAKFGGTSVGDAAAIGRAVAIVRGRQPRAPVVVVSALAGVTNALIEIAERAGAGQLLIAIRQIEELRERHLQVAAELLGDADESRELTAETSASFDELAQLAEALSVLGHVTPRC